MWRVFFCLHRDRCVVAYRERNQETKRKSRRHKTDMVHYHREAVYPRDASGATATESKTSGPSQDEDQCPSKPRQSHPSRHAKGHTKRGQHQSILASPYGALVHFRDFNRYIYIYRPSGCKVMKRFNIHLYRSR